MLLNKRRKKNSDAKVWQRDVKAYIMYVWQRIRVVHSENQSKSTICDSISHVYERISFQTGKSFNILCTLHVLIQALCGCLDFNRI